MSEARSRYSRLEPFSIKERVRLSLLAVNFFSAMHYEEVCTVLKKETTPGRVQPLEASEFLKYLETTNELPEAGRYLYRIGELLSQLADAHLLTDMGRGRSVMLGTHYYFIREFTQLERKNVLWLTPALGPEFILRAFTPFIVQITGKDKNGDVRAGTGLMIEPNWLLTCAHVLNSMSVDERQIFSGREFQVRRTLSHANIDVGLIEISPGYASLVGLAFKEPRIAETIFTLGYPRIPLSREPSLIMHRGEVTSSPVTTFAGQTVFLYSAIARPGNSGGPIISLTGHVIGMVTEELREDADPTSSFYAGIGALEIVAAVSELGVSVSVPIEDYQ
jgi:hypothetical protein